jgi:hypothetical protein
VAVLGNTEYEPNKTFFLVLENAVDADIGINQATASLLNDDPLPPLSITSLTWDEADLLIEFVAAVPRGAAWIRDAVTNLALRSVAALQQARFVPTHKCHTCISKSSSRR